MKIYELKAEINDEGKFNISSKCDGFNGLEVLGILELKVNDVLDQLSGKTHPDTIKREVVVNEQGFPD